GLQLQALDGRVQADLQQALLQQGQKVLAAPAGTRHLDVQAGFMQVVAAAFGLQQDQQLAAGQLALLQPLFQSVQQALQTVQQGAAGAGGVIQIQGQLESGRRLQPVQDQFPFAVGLVQAQQQIAQTALRQAIARQLAQLAQAPAAQTVQPAQFVRRGVQQIHRQGVQAWLQTAQAPALPPWRERQHPGAPGGGGQRRAQTGQQGLQVLPYAGVQRAQSAEQHQAGAQVQQKNAGLRLRQLRAVAQQQGQHGLDLFAAGIRRGAVAGQG